MEKFYEVMGVFVWRAMIQVRQSVKIVLAVVLSGGVYPFFYSPTLSNCLRLFFPAALNCEGVMPVTLLNWVLRYAVLE